MPATAKITVSGTITGMSEGGNLGLGPINYIPTSAIVGRIDPLDLASGNNTIVVPSGATIMWFTPPAANTQAIRMKVSGDTSGHGIFKNISWPYPLDGSGEDIVLNAAGAVNGCTVQFA